MNQLDTVLGTLSSNAISWLTDPASLTKRLRLFTDNQIEHHLFYNDWDETQSNWIRRMEWRYRNVVWVACVVTIPRTSLIEELAEVGHRAIGEILFQDPNLTRSPFVFTQENGHVTRVSTFHFKGHPLDITETFSPAFFEAVQ